MASFRVNSNVSSVYLTVTYTIGSYNITANTTPVTVSMTITHGGMWVGAGTNDCKLWIGNEVKSWTGPDIYNNSGGTENLGSKTFNVPHNSDGTWHGEIGASYRLGINYGGTYIGTISGSDTVTLPTIPRASSFTVGDITIGSASTVTISRASSNFTHTVTLTLDSSRSLTASHVGTSTTLTPPLTWCNGIINATRATGTIIVDTYSDSTKIGSSSKKVSIIVPSSVVPSVSATATLVNGFQGLYLQGRSKVTINSTGTGAYGSTIKSYSVSGAGYSGSGDSYTTGVLNVTGTVTFTVTVVDSRGRTKSTSVDITVISYSKPTITIQRIGRCTSDGTSSEEGTYASIKVAIGFASVNEKNAISSTVSYRKRGDTAWSGSTPIVTESEKVVFNGALDATNDYEVRIYAEDAVSEKAETVQVISSSANYLIAAKQGIMGLLRYPDLNKTGVQVGGNLYIDGLTVGGPVFGLGTAQAQITDDFNNYIIPGTYGVRADTSMASIQNAPPVGNKAGILIVRADTGDIIENPITQNVWSYVQQIYIPRNNEQMYSRLMRNNGTTTATWSAWEMWPPKDSRYLDASGGTVGALWAKRDSGESNIGVDTGSHRLYLYANSTTGAIGMYDNTYGYVISYNNSNTPHWAGEPISIAKGGTGATTASGAAANLGFKITTVYNNTSGTSSAISFSPTGNTFTLVEGHPGSATSFASVLCYSYGKWEFSDCDGWYSFNLSASGISARVSGSGVITRVVTITFPY